MSLRLFRCMSVVARSTYLSMTLSLIQMTIVVDLLHDKIKLIRNISVFTENFGMTFAKKGHAGVAGFAETEINQHFGKTLPTHFNITTHASHIYMHFHVITYIAQHTIYI